MSVKVSVIIPVYNAEKYITQCIESLLNQTLNECEFIFINDGSRDYSKKLIEDYQKIDTRIKLINQENQGVSIARNNGLQLAQGEYIGFVDADDHIEKDMYETLYRPAKQDDCDAVISNFQSEMEARKFITSYSFPLNKILYKDFIEKEILPYFLKAEDLNSVVNKIFKRQVITENRVVFPEKVALGEDGLFNTRFFSHATSVRYIDYAGYHYREVAGSATRNVAGKDYFQRALEVYKLQLPEKYTGKLDRTKIQFLKSIKLMNSVMAYIHMYFTPTQDLSFIKRYKYVKNMICHEVVREVLPLYMKEKSETIGRYEKFILSMVEKKLTIGLYFASAYSRYRNKNNGGGNLQ